MSSITQQPNIFSNFPEVPMDAFDVFNESKHHLQLPPLYKLKLVRTYKADCPVCGGRSSTIDCNIRVVPCYYCNLLATKIQSLVRGRIARKKYKKLI